MQHKEKNIKKVMLLNDHTIFWKENSIFCDGIKIYSGDIVNVHFGYGNIFIEKNYSGDNVVLNIEHTKKKIEFNTKTNGFLMFLNQQMYFRNSFNEDFTRTFISTFSFHEMKEIWKKECNNLKNYLIREDLLIVNSGKTLIAYKISSGEIEWSKNNSEFDKEINLIKFLSSHSHFSGLKDILIACDSGMILLIEKNKGKLVRFWQHIPNFTFDSEIQNRIPRSDSFVLYADKLLGALNRFYFEIDINQEGVRHFDLSEELAKYDIFHIKQLNDNPVTENHIYLTAMIRQ